jgi:hypothetical protein
MASSPNGLIPLVVTDYPNSDPDQRVRIEVTLEEMEKIGKLAIVAVGLETEPTDEEEKRTRFVIPVVKFAILTTVAPMEEVLANAETVVPPSKSQRQSPRRSHNERADRGALVNYNEPDNSRFAAQGEDR